MAVASMAVTWTAVAARALVAAARERAVVAQAPSEVAAREMVAVAAVASDAAGVVVVGRVEALATAGVAEMTVAMGGAAGAGCL